MKDINKQVKGIEDKIEDLRADLANLMNLWVEHKAMAIEQEFGLKLGSVVEVNQYKHKKIPFKGKVIAIKPGKDFGDINVVVSLLSATGLVTDSLYEFKFTKEDITLLN